MSRGELEENIVIGGNSVLGERAAPAIQTFGALQTITSTLIVMVFFVNRGAVIVKRRWQQRATEMRQRRASLLEDTGMAFYSQGNVPAWRLLMEYGPGEDGVTDKLDDWRGNFPVYALYRMQSIIFLLGDGTVMYYVLYVIFTWLGNFASPFFFCFHLLDLMYRFEARCAGARSCMGVDDNVTAAATPQRDARRCLPAQAASPHARPWTRRDLRVQVPLALWDAACAFNVARALPASLVLSNSGTPTTRIRATSI